MQLQPALRVPGLSMQPARQHCGQKSRATSPGWPAGSHWCGCCQQWAAAPARWRCSAGASLLRPGCPWAHWHFGCFPPMPRRGPGGRGPRPGWDCPAVRARPARPAAGRPMWSTTAAPGAGRFLHLRLLQGRARPEWSMPAACALGQGMRSRLPAGLSAPPCSRYAAGFGRMKRARLAHELQGWRTQQQNSWT